MNRKQWFATIGAAVSAVSLGTSVSFASTTPTTGVININHSAYLRSGPALRDSAIVLERTGAKLALVSGSTAGWWHVRNANGRYGYVIRKPYWTSYGASSTNVSSAFASSAKLPPGVSYDRNVRSFASLSASYQTKFNAVMRVAKSKLGTPYIWGHNEDRGQYGFDCSNFTSYVYHHALGYKMSGSSQVQYHSVGWRVPISSMQPGDLVIFNRGGHVGIYAGHGEMIEEGGGLGKVGYLKLSPGSYWYKHITTVKRMF